MFYLLVRHGCHDFCCSESFFALRGLKVWEGLHGGAHDEFIVGWVWRACNSRAASMKLIPSTWNLYGKIYIKQHGDEYLVDNMIT